MKTRPFCYRRVYELFIHLLTIWAVIPGQNIIHVEVISTLHRSSLRIAGRMNTERKLVLLRQHPEVIYIGHIYEVLFCRVHFNGNSSGTEKLILDW